MKRINLQLFAEENIIKTVDMEPAISIDHASKLTGSLKTLQKVLGITDMTPMNAGSVIKIYKLEQTNTPEQVAEGEKINLTKFTRTLARTIELTLKKYRKVTTAEDIQKVGKDLAVNQTDEKLISGIQKDIKNNFFDVLLTGTGAASGNGLQGTLAQVWGKLQTIFDDEDVSPVYLVSSDDIADYLGSAQVTMQNAFGMSYIEDFLGLGTVIVSPKVTKGKVIGTAKENLFGAYAPAGSGDVGRSLGLTSDSTGYVGMKHYVADEEASLGTLAMANVVFYPELLDGVVVGTISGTDA